MLLELARWRVELELSPAALVDRLAPRLARFACARAATTDFVVVVHGEAPEANAPGTSESILHASLTKKGEDYLLDGTTFYGMIDALRGRAELRMRSAEPAREAEYFLRIALALFALRRDGLLLHCAALMRESATGTDPTCTRDDAATGCPIRGPKRER